HRRRPCLGAVGSIHGCHIAPQDGGVLSLCLLAAASLPQRSGGHRSPPLFKIDLRGPTWNARSVRLARPSKGKSNSCSPPCRHGRAKTSTISPLLEGSATLIGGSDLAATREPFS